MGRRRALERVQSRAKLPACHFGIQGRVSLGGGVRDCKRRIRVAARGARSSTGSISKRTDLDLAGVQQHDQRPRGQDEKELQGSFAGIQPSAGNRPATGHQEIPTHPHGQDTTITQQQPRIEEDPASEHGSRFDGPWQEAVQVLAEHELQPQQTSKNQQALQQEPDEHGAALVSMTINPCLMCEKEEGGGEAGDDVSERLFGAAEVVVDFKSGVMTESAHGEPDGVVLQLPAQEPQGDGPIAALPPVALLLRTLGLSLRLIVSV